MSDTTQVKSKPSPSSYIVLLSGTHVTGKETLAVFLSKALGCPWIKADMVQSAATIGSRSQARKGYDYGKVFGRIWFSKMQRLGFLTDEGQPAVQSKIEVAGKLKTADCKAVISLGHMRKPARDAIQDILLVHSVRPIFVIMHITKETLSGRTLGAEEPKLAERIMEQKMADIQVPLEEEKDVVLIDSMRDVDTVFLEIMEEIPRLLQVDL